MNSALRDSIEVATLTMEDAMQTEITRQQYRRDGPRYASDLTDDEWG